jgi:hypothetical protein
VITYRNISEAEHHVVISEIEYDQEELLDFFNSFPEKCLLPWNEFKKKYNPNNPYRKTLTDKFKQVYAPASEGKELIEYDVIQRILEKFNFVKPLKVTDIQILAYDPGFTFVPHIDQEVKTNLMFPIIPQDGGEPLTLYAGDDYKNPGHMMYKLYYSTRHPTMVSGKVIHAVEEMKERRVVLRIRTDDEDYESMRDRYKSGVFVNAK